MNENVKNYYNTYAEKEWARLEAVVPIEWHTTMRVISEITGQQKLRILDLGGGVGRYSIELTKRGHEVTLVDISEGSLRLAESKANEVGVNIAKMVCSSATDLEMFDSNTFDLVLSLGPMYHLTEDEDLMAANRELLRVVKSDGYVVVAFITKLAVIRDVMERRPNVLAEHLERYKKIMLDGVIVQGLESGFTDLRVFNAREIEPLMNKAGFITERLVGCEGPLNILGYPLANALGSAEREQVFDFVYQFTSWPTLLDASDHVLFIGRKGTESQ